MTAAAELSVVVVTWNGDDLLRGCLESLARTYGDALETVVVDNADAESTRALVGGFAGVKYVPSPGNPGFAGGNNIGVRETTRPYILLLNNDTIVHEDSFTPLVEFLKAHERVGIVQGTMVIPGRGLDVCGEDLMPWGLLRHRCLGSSPTETRLEAVRVSAAKGAMLMLKRAILPSVGNRLFDPSFRNYFEDIDLCLRAGNAGWETWFVPTPPIDHFCGATSGRFDSRMIWRRYFRNIMYSFWRNFGFFGRFFTLPCFVFAAFVRSPSALCGAMADCIRGRAKPTID